MLQEENKVGNDASESINDDRMPDSDKQLREADENCTCQFQQLQLKSHEPHCAFFRQPEETDRESYQRTASFKFAPFPEDQTHVDLVNDDGEVKVKLSLDDVDPVSQAPFREMITEAFSQGKHFFLAKINAKNFNEYSQADDANHSHFYNAYSIIRLLFKKRNNMFVGRFHETYPITVKNPATNGRIVGEVEFYKITNQRIERRETALTATGAPFASPTDLDDALHDKEMNDDVDVGISTPDAGARKEANMKIKSGDNVSELLADLSSPIQSIPVLKNKSVNDSESAYLRGDFFGTDFNFIYSEEMQKAFIQNCLPANWNQAMKFHEYTGRSNNIQDEFAAFANPNLDFDAQMSEIVRQSFKNTKKYVWQGAFAFLFYFCAIYTLKDGILPLMANTFPGQPRRQRDDQTMELTNTNEQEVDNGRLTGPGVPWANDETDEKQEDGEDVGDSEG